MTPHFYFALGFLCSFVMCAGLAGLYYSRAKRRVESIKAAILQSQAAQRAVSQACDRAYPKSTP